LTSATGAELLGWAFQMTLSEACNSAKTVVAATASSAIATIVASMPDPSSPALVIMLWTAAAPSRPNSSLSCPMIAPSAASSPKTRPTTAITRIRIGAREKMV
jgi:hypothetical protein